MLLGVAFLVDHYMLMGIAAVLGGIGLLPLSVVVAVPGGGRDQLMKLLRRVIRRDDSVKQ